jgi:hypothetical protein
MIIAKSSGRTTSGPKRRPKTFKFVIVETPYCPLIVPIRSPDMEALISDTDIMNSENAKSTAMSQSHEIIRNKVWPTDIFSNKANSQNIAQLLPAGKHQHKEWMCVGTAVVGLTLEASSETLKKAVRGFKNENDRTRVPGTGVVQCISNKLRMAYQTAKLDGVNPSALLIPVMELEDANSWNGTAYSALFVMGWPKNEGPPKKNYDVHLSTDEVIIGGVISDATISEIEVARTTLIEAVLALRNLLAQMTPERIQRLGI